MKGHIDQHFKYDNGVWTTNFSGNILTGSGIRNGESGLPWQGFDPTAKRRHWAIPGALVNDLFEATGEILDGLTQHEKLDRLHELGMIKIIPGQAWPIYERVLKDSDGQPLSDIWACQPHTDGTVFGNDRGIDEDIRWLATSDQERLGYQTQKPEGLLGRIIRASSDVGDVVLDPFCGCGTTVSVAHKMGRRWIGIDITYLAVALIKRRLIDQHDSSIVASFDVVGEPVDMNGVKGLLEERDGRYQFQYWVLDRLGARTATSDKKKGADQGVDGRLYFHDDADTGKSKQIIFSVKSGNTGPRDVRDLQGVVDSTPGAEIGVFVTLNPPTATMESQALKSGFYTSPWDSARMYRRLQIITVEEILRGVEVDMPPSRDIRTFKKAPKARMRDRPDTHHSRRKSLEGRNLLFGDDSHAETNVVSPDPTKVDPRG